MTETALPNVYTYGRVVGRVITAVGDLTDSGDPYPDAVPVVSTGGVTFTPSVRSRIVTGVAPSTLVQHQSITCDLDADGNLSINGQIGVWLYVGVWAVSFSPVIGMTSFQIEVTTAHTDSSPLDLFAVAPYMPSSGSSVTTMLVPSGPSDGQSLVWSSSSGSLVWGSDGIRNGLGYWTLLADSDTTFPARSTIPSWWSGYVKYDSSFYLGHSDPTDMLVGDQHVKRTS